MFKVTLKDPKTGVEIVVGDPGEAARLKAAGYKEVAPPAPVKVEPRPLVEKPKTDSK